MLNVKTKLLLCLHSFMLQSFFSWRILLALLAILIVSGTISYSSYLAKKIEREERQKVAQWVAAGTFINNPANSDIRLASMIILQTDIPIIEATEKDSITNWVNLDSTAVLAGWSTGDDVRLANSNTYLQQRLKSYKATNPPVEWINPTDSTQRNLYYFGPSRLLQEVRYYPMVQLLIVGLFIIVVVLLLRSSYRSTQNQVWAGMAKETAHQLGTPVSSLEGWLEILRDIPGNERVVPELEKDVQRLQLVSDRFGKIGSKPQLEPRNLVEQVSNMVEYIRKRAPGKMAFHINAPAQQITAPLSPPLFDWVIENLLKNALDAMEGKGSISIDIQEQPKEVLIDITDNGKGILKKNLRKVFRPGFTTKRRGWGLGLSLSKRIVDQYHGGNLFVKNSEPGKGTTFRIVLRK
ncbi:Signal transduction histidine kinase [Cnuella takakiae]|uniref:histidine kinase n=2 Tax=Cnuella takakiae TaxID=1302690 RepID=A0A1M5B6T4_9BACT|nr:Signal transduction histidine kinase [Cnuella takakiae]